MLGTMTVYTLFHLGQALAQNIQTLMICRFFGGFFAVGPLTVNGGEHFVTFLYVLVPHTRTL